jgi:DNA-binding transcriptional LysR family regulator
VSSPPTRTPDLTELRSLVAAADSGTLGRAALRLHISQPALTKRLQVLEQLVGTTLLERSPKGVALTPAGRRLYEHARPILAHAEALDTVVTTLRREAAPVRLAVSHSAAEAFVTDALRPGTTNGELALELVIANSMVVRGLVADGRADIGVCAGRPRATPNPVLHEETLCDDEVVCAVPRGHPWAARERITRQEFVRTPMVVRDPSSNARWTVDSVLRQAGVRAAPPIAQAPTPGAARHEALAHNAPTLLSRWVLGEQLVPVAVDGLRFARRFMLVLPAGAGPAGSVSAVADLLLAAAPHAAR